MLAYSIRRSKRARTLSLVVYPGGAIVVMAPDRTEIDAIERFVGRHADWARRHALRMRARTVVKVARRDIPRLKRDALVFAESRAMQYAARYGVTYAKITIRAQKSRWGSCSRVGNLSFNYKIAALPRHLAEYVIVHEICHRLAFDHSKRFWELVAREIPDHRARRAELRRIAFRFN